MTAIIYDFHTGRKVKLCSKCHYYKDLEDFNFSVFGKYKRAAWCRACSPEQLLAAPASTDNVNFIFEMEEDDSLRPSGDDDEIT